LTYNDVIIDQVGTLTPCQKRGVNARGQVVPAQAPGKWFLHYFIQMSYFLKTIRLKRNIWVDKDVSSGLNS